MMLLEAILSTPLMLLHEELTEHDMKEYGLSYLKVQFLTSAVISGY